MPPRLLFLCQNLPYPPHGGALIRSYHTLRLLSSEYDVTGLFFFRPSIRTSEDDLQSAINQLSRFAEVHAFPIPQNQSAVRFAADHVRSLITRSPYTRWMYDSGPARRAVQRLVAERDFDLVHLDSLDLTAFLPDLPEVPWACAHHNVESQLLRRRADAESGLRRAYIRHQARLTEREERTWCERFAINLVVSQEDRDLFSLLAPDGRYLVVPNGVDTKEFHPDARQEPPSGLVFVGGHDWFPNSDGMEYFTDAILPLIRAERPDVQVTWVGRAEEAVRRKYEARNVHMTGYVDDIRPFMNQAACSVVPLRVGGGTRLKILDAWALGKAVVSTSPGCEGLEVSDGENMLVADDPETFATAVLRVLDSPALRTRLEQGGRRMAEQVYDWDVVGERMLGAYREIIADGRAH